MNEHFENMSLREPNDAVKNGFTDCAWFEDSGECAIKTILDRHETVYCEYCGGSSECPRYVKDVG